MTDSLYVNIVTDVIAHPAFTNSMIALITAVIGFIVGLLKIRPKDAQKFLKIGAAVALGIMDAEEKSNVRTARSYPKLDGAEKHTMAAEVGLDIVKKALPKKSKLKEGIDTFGSVVSIVFPLVQPFLKKGK